MNQILSSEEIYLSPKLKKKRLIYKINFAIALIFMVLLLGYYVYGEYQKQEEEQRASQVLNSLRVSLNDTTDSNIRLTTDETVILLNGKQQNGAELKRTRTQQEEEAYKRTRRETEGVAPSGAKYYSIGSIEIPKIGVKYAILNDSTDEFLKISPTYFYGPDPNKEGNLCIVGHNYRNDKFFSKVPTLQNGDIIKITDVLGKTIDYVIYDMYVVEPENTQSTDQKTDGKKEVTLITCTNDSVHRVIVKAREVNT